MIQIIRSISSLRKVADSFSDVCGVAGDELLAGAGYNIKIRVNVVNAINTMQLTGTAQKRVSLCLALFFAAGDCRRYGAGKTSNVATAEIKRRATVTNSLRTAARTTPPPRLIGLA